MNIKFKKEKLKMTDTPSKMQKVAVLAACMAFFSPIGIAYAYDGLMARCDMDLGDRIGQKRIEAYKESEACRNLPILLSWIYQPPKP